MPLNYSLSRLFTYSSLICCGSPSPPNRFTSLRAAPIWPSAILVYFLLAIGVVFFVLPKADNYVHALLWGALFGFVVYGVYDLTNYALLDNWSLSITLIDMLWGAVLCGLTASFALFIHRWLA